MTTDLYTHMGFILNANASLTRIPDFPPATVASADPSNPVLTKDVPINKVTGTWARLYLPRPDSASSPTIKLPIIVYYHGSGFVVSSAASMIYQKFCSDIVLKIPAVMVSVEYRLAPEHRLPAAYDDGEEVLHWLKASNDEWLVKHGDLSKCYLMGTSAGGNIAYHVALRVAAQSPEKIRGLILHQPFFGAVERTPSEMRVANDNFKALPPSMTDVMWSLALPVGADRDHDYCNSTKGVNVELLEKMKSEGWKLLVTGCDGDPLIDRQLEFAKVMRENGVTVIEEFSKGGRHGIEIYDESRAAILNGVIKKFILDQNQN